jgi:hypothetical protein
MSGHPPALPQQRPGPMFRAFFFPMNVQFWYLNGYIHSSRSTTSARECIQPQSE